MSRVRDLWHVEGRDPADPTRKVKRKTKRHPDNGGNKNAARWLAVWIDPDGRECTKAFHGKERAKEYAAKQEADVVRDEYIGPDAGEELLGPLAKKWIKLREISSGSRDKYERCNRLHVEPTFGHRKVKAPRPSEILEWLRDLGKTHGEATQALAYMILSGTFDLAVADGMRRHNPVRSPIVPRPEPELAEREPWTVERVWGVVDAHPEAYRAIPIVSAGCGLRECEAFALAEEDFDFEAGKVVIRRQIHLLRGRWTFKAPKGGKERTAPLSPGVARIVQAHIQAYPPRPYALPWEMENGDLEDEPHACKLLFRWRGDDPRTHDKHIRPRGYDQGVWKPALVTAGVIPERERPKEGGRARYAVARQDGTHALRHWNSTTLMDAGVSLAGIMDFLGHSRKSAHVTLRVYGHTTEETFEAARDAIDRSLFRLRAVQDQSAGGTVAERAGSA